MELSNLNDDCLRHIFRNLDIVDLYHVGISCQRFNNIVGSFSRNFSIITSDIVSLLEYKKRFHSAESLFAAIDLFFDTVGHHVRAIDLFAPYHQLSTTTADILRIVQKYCWHSLRHLHLKKYNQLNFVQIHNFFIHLTSLDLKHCDCSGSLRLTEQTHLESITLIDCQISIDDIHELLQHSDALKHLRIFGPLLAIENSILRLSDSVARLANLQCLSLTSKTTNDLRFIAKLPALQHLQLIGYHDYESQNIIDGTLSALLLASSSGACLVELDLTSCNLLDRSFATIARLPYLKSLTMSKNFWLSDDHLKLMGTLYGGLTYFQCFDCLKLTDVGVTAFVQHNAQLRYIDVSWCFRITEASVASACAVVLQRSRCSVSGRSATDVNGNLILGKVPKILMTFVAGGRTLINRKVVEVGHIASSGNTH